MPQATVARARTPRASRAPSSAEMMRSAPGAPHAPHAARCVRSSQPPKCMGRPTTGNPVASPNSHYAGESLDHHRALVVERLAELEDGEGLALTEADGGEHLVDARSRRGLQHQRVVARDGHVSPDADFAGMLCVSCSRTVRQSTRPNASLSRSRSSARPNAPIPWPVTTSGRAATR